MGQNDVFQSERHVERIRRIRLAGTRNAEWCDDRPVQWLGREPFHEVWMEHSGDPFEIRLCRAQAAWHASFPADIIPGQLLVGADIPMTVVAYRTGCFSWDIRLDKRLRDWSKTTRQAYDYWEKWLADREACPVVEGCDDPVFREYAGIVGIGCHSTQDYGLLLKNGLNGLLDKIQRMKNKNPDASTWYEGLAISLEGIRGCLHNMANALQNALESCHDTVQRDEWQDMKERLDFLSRGDAPRMFHDAVMLFWLVFRLVGHDSPGRMDQYLWPYLKRDLEEKTITWERAMEITDCLYFMLDRYVSYGTTLGGQLPEGGDGINSMSWLCLSSIRRLRLLSPRTALRWHPDMPEEFFKEAVESMASGATFPTLVNDQVVIPAMISRGASPAHARDYTFCGCGQVTPMGRAYGSYEDIILNSVKPFHLVLHDGMDENHPVHIGPATGHLECFSDYDAFEQAVWCQMESLLEKSISQSNRIKEWGARHLLDPLRSLLTHSCLEKALDFRAGGADYHEGMVDVVGFASLVDSLNAVRQLVFEEKRMSLMELRDILDQNWDGRESLRLECRNRLSKFGNDEEASDETSIRLMTRLNEYLSRQKTFMGGPWGLDIIGWSAAVQMGGNTGATPDGRKKGEPIADSGGPAQGRDKKGITAVFRSMVKLPLDKTHGPVALSVRIAGSSLKNTENVEKLKDLLESYMRMGGQQIQVTVADSLLLQEAQNNPDAHRDLIVRVGGFSAYFTRLEKCYQDDIISRSEHSV